MPLITGSASGPSSTVIARTRLQPDAAIAAVAAFDVPTMLAGWGPFPAVLRVEGQTGAWDHVGATRVAYLADRGRVRETIVQWVPGVGFAYELTGFTDVFGRLVRGVRGEWSVLPEAGGAMLRWTWEFAPLPGRRLLMHAVVGPLWRVAMQRSITRVVRVIERDANHPGDRP